ncbi:MAG: hypothetical protein WHV44_02550 [Anaerolineales bacterium]
MFKDASGMVGTAVGTGGGSDRVVGGNVTADCAPEPADAEDEQAVRKGIIKTNNQTKMRDCLSDNSLY